LLRDRDKDDEKTGWQAGSLRHEVLQFWLTPTGQGAWYLLTICCFPGMTVPCNLDVKEGS